jgi:hypothetical protein
MCALRVTSPKEILNIIIPHFDKYPLITKKQARVRERCRFYFILFYFILFYFILFKNIVMLMEQGEHLKVEGLQQIVNIRASLNLGLSKV